MRLYVTPTSPYARLAMIARLEKGLDEIELVWTRTRVPDDPMLVFNPSGRIPYLRLDDGTGFEDTDVIVDYMDALAPPLRFAAPGGGDRWPHRARRAMARSLLDGVAVWAREIVRPETERSPGIIEHERRRAARLADRFEAGIESPAYRGALDMPQLFLFCALDGRTAPAGLRLADGTPRPRRLARKGGRAALGGRLAAAGGGVMRGRPFRTRKADGPRVTIAADTGRVFET